MDEHAFPPTGFAVARLGHSLHLVAAVGWFYPLPVIIHVLEHAFLLTGFAVAWLGCSLHLVAAVG